MPDLLVVAATSREVAVVGALAPTLRCGIGPVEAAATTARALALDPPRALLHIGLAGLRRGCGIRVLELVLGTEARYCDVAAAVHVVDRALPDERLLAAAREALPGARALPIGTSASVGGTSGCDVEAMEGFGVLRAAQLAGVPALELRAVVNEIEEPDRARWRFDEGLAALADVVPRLVAALGR